MPIFLVIIPIEKGPLASCTGCLRGERKDKVFLRAQLVQARAIGDCCFAGAVWSGRKKKYKGSFLICRIVCKGTQTCKRSQHAEGFSL